MDFTFIKQVRNIPKNKREKLHKFALLYPIIPIYKTMTDIQLFEKKKHSVGKPFFPQLLEFKEITIF